MPCLREQLADDHLGLVVSALAEVVVSLAPLRVEEVVGGPVSVVERFPRHVIIIECDGVADFEVLHGLDDVLRIALEGELRRVHTDHHQPIIAIALVPRANIRN